MSWYRESYILTLCDEPNENAGENKNDSFDVSQMETGRFESFAEVMLRSDPLTYYLTV